MNSDADRHEPAVRRLATAEEHAAVYAAVVQSALDAVIVVDENGLVVTLNPAAEVSFGYALDEAVGRSIGELIVPEHLRDGHERGMARYRATRRPSVLGRRVEMEALCKDGRVIPVELAITEVPLPGRRLFTANLRDLSAARAAAEEIERQREALHQNEKLAALGSLLAGVAHEINNPLSIVLGQANMICEQAAEIESGAPLLERARKIEVAAERCARIVRSFLAIARQRRPEKREIEIAPLLDGAIELLHYNLHSAGIVVTRAYDDGLPNVFADQDQVHQIVVNLIVNAAQALETVSRRELRISASAGPEETVQIVVADSGPGVPAKIAAQIFDPFFTTKPAGAGTGIGLSVSRGLAQSQDGDLTLRASELGGAAFELCLPAAAGRSHDDPAAQPVEPDQAPIRAAADNAGRALILDDEPDVAAMVAEILDAIGYVSDIASSGREGQALIAANADGYDAVICDLRMPDIDGPALFEWIEAHHPDLAGRTLFFTGDSLGPNASRFLSTCGRPVIEKPFSPADVIREVSGIPARSA